jgi:hypothetical protein
VPRLASLLAHGDQRTPSLRVGHVHRSAPANKGISTGIGRRAYEAARSGVTLNNNVCVPRVKRPKSAPAILPTSNLTVRRSV